MTPPRTSKPLHQRAVLVLGWLVGGVTAFGALLDALSNSIHLVTPPVTYVGSALLMVGWVAAGLYVHVRGLPWVHKQGQTVRLRRLGPAIHCTLVGVLLLLWTPRFADAFRFGPTREIGPESAKLAAVPTPREDTVVTEIHEAGPLDSLAAAGMEIYRADTMDMDASGEGEIIASWVHPGEVPGAFEVFSRIDDEWRSVLRLPTLRWDCSSIWEHDWLNLFGDQSRQLVIWTQCAAGATVQVFSYRGMGFLERVANLTLDDEVVHVVGNRLFLVPEAGTDARLCTWNQGFLRCQEEPLDPGDRTIYVEYAVDDDGMTLRAYGSPDVVTNDTIHLARGDFLALQPQKNAAGAYRLLFSHDGVLESRPPFFFASNPGLTSIKLEAPGGAEGRFEVVVSPDN